MGQQYLHLELHLQRKKKNERPSVMVLANQIERCLMRRGTFLDCAPQLAPIPYSWCHSYRHVDSVSSLQKELKECISEVEGIYHFTLKKLYSFCFVCVYVFYCCGCAVVVGGVDNNSNELTIWSICSPICSPISSWV